MTAMAGEPVRAGLKPTTTTPDAAQPKPIGKEEVTAAVSEPYGKYKEAYVEADARWKEEEPKLREKCTETRKQQDLRGATQTYKVFNAAAFQRASQQFKNEHQPKLDKLWAKVEEAQDTVLKPYRDRMLAKDTDEAARNEFIRLKRLIADMYPKFPK